MLTVWRSPAFWMGVSVMSTDMPAYGPMATSSDGSGWTFKPKTTIGRWATGLGIATAAWGAIFPFFGSVVRALQVERLPFPVGAGGATIEVVLALAALVTGVIAVTRRERSWLFVIGFGLAAVVGGFWLLFVAGEVFFPH